MYVYTYIQTPITAHLVPYTFTKWEVRKSNYNQKNQ